MAAHPTGLNVRPIAGASMTMGSVILIREQGGQLTGSGCCGRLEGDFATTCDGEPVFRQRRAVVEAMGPLYRGLRSRFADAVDLEVVDPRNVVSLIYLLIRDFRRFDVGFRDALRTLSGIRAQTVIVNGRLSATGRWPEPEEVAALLERSRAVPRRRYG